MKSKPTAPLAERLRKLMPLATPSAAMSAHTDMQTGKDSARAHSLTPLVRPWNPGNMVIKATGVRICDNDGCMTPAAGAFEQDGAVWLACDDCTPSDVDTTKLGPNDQAER